MRRLLQTRSTAAVAAVNVSGLLPVCDSVAVTGMVYREEGRCRGERKRDMRTDTNAGAMAGVCQMQGTTACMPVNLSKILRTPSQGLNLQVRAKSSSGCVCSCRCAGRHARCFIVLAIAPSTSCDITAMLLPPCRCCYSQ